MIRVRYAAVVFALAAFCAAADARADVRPSSKAPGSALGPLGSRLEVRKVVGLVGQTITLEAVLTRAEGGAPVAGKSVSFRVKGTPGGDVAAGGGATDASGRVRVPFQVPELKQAPYDLTALYAGDPPGAGPATGASSLTVFKSETKLRLSEGLDAAPGSHGHTSAAAREHQWVQIHLTRKTDGREVTGRKVRVTLDGKPLPDEGSGGAVRLPDGPFPAGLAMVPWVVEARFQGDDCYQSTEPARLLVKKKP